jgi:hypothetical protein
MHDDLTRRPSASPADLLSTDVESSVWHEDGWECGALGSVSDARKRTRGQAAACFAHEIGDFRSVRVWKRYIRSLTRQDAWENRGRERYEETHELEFDTAPELVPDDWDADEEDEVWCFVHRNHPGAIPVWICGEKGSRPPHAPRKASS